VGVFAIGSVGDGLGGAAMTDSNIEAEIQAKGLTAPRVTPQRIEEVIAGEYYFTAADGVEGRLDRSDVPPNTKHYNEALRLLTFCVLVLKNGFTVTGESACASPENFNAELGRKIARSNAVNKIWPLEGYLLKQQLHLASGATGSARPVVLVRHEYRVETDNCSCGQPWPCAMQLSAAMANKEAR